VVVARWQVGSGGGGAGGVAVAGGRQRAQRGAPPRCRYRAYSCA